MRAVLGHLERIGLLLETDAQRPSVASLVAGEPIRGSWWAHAKGQAIFHTLDALLDHPDVAAVKLVDGKVTLVHRALWPALLDVATAREPWQTDGLRAAAKKLLQTVERRGEVQLTKASDDARELERRLLVLGASVHTESGAHMKVLRTWARWASEAKVAPMSDPAAAKRALEEAVTRLGGGTLPWQARAARKPASRGRA